MLNGDIEEEDEEIIYDQGNFIDSASKSLSASGPILLSLNQFNIRKKNDSHSVSRDKTIILAVTCTSIGMFTGLLGPTFPFLAENMSTELSSIIWFLGVKAIGFLLGTCLSSYLYTWFNVCCILGLSCLSISFGVCSLAFIVDLTAFYITALILGIGLGLSYNGVDALYNRFWARPSQSNIRWLHLLVALGAILSTMVLLFSTLPSDDNIFFTTNVTQSPRIRRAIIENTTLPSNLSSTILQLITKPKVVASEILAKSLYTKPRVSNEQSTTKLQCLKSYCCCYMENDRNNTFTCQEQNKNQSDHCQQVLSLCGMVSSNICHLNLNNTWCRIDRRCANETTLDCSMQLIDKVINANRSSVIPSSTLMTESSTSTMKTTKRYTKHSTSENEHNYSVKSTASITTMKTTATKARVRVIYRNKPPTADSANDDLSKNFFYLKIRLFLQSITTIHILYLFLTSLFFLLGIFYSVLAMGGEDVNSSSITNLSPLPLLFLKPHRIVPNSNIQISLLSDLTSLRFVILILLFYLILIGFESSCTYLTYSIGIKFSLSEKKSLILQLCYLSGRFIDILLNYIWFLLDKYKKKQSTIISLKCLILIRLIILFLICFFSVFHQTIHLLFFSVGFFLTSLSSLILYWLEHDLSFNQVFLRMILLTVILSEMIFPVFLFHMSEYFIQSYLFIGLALLISLFLIILYTSKNGQQNRMYRSLPTSMTMDEMESQENSDNERVQDTKLH